VTVVGAVESRRKETGIGTAVETEVITKIIVIGTMVEAEVDPGSEGKTVYIKKNVKMGDKAIKEATEKIVSRILLSHQAHRCIIIHNE
jgi:hypothetical protein